MAMDHTLLILEPGGSSLATLYPVFPHSGPFLSILKALSSSLLNLTLPVLPLNPLWLSTPNTVKSRLLVEPTMPFTIHPHVYCTGPCCHLLLASTPAVTLLPHYWSTTLLPQIHSPHGSAALGMCLEVQLTSGNLQ